MISCMDQMDLITPCNVQGIKLCMLNYVHIFYSQFVNFIPPPKKKKVISPFFVIFHITSIKGSLAAARSVFHMHN